MNSERTPAARDGASPGRQRRHASFAALALLAAVATAPRASAQQVWTDRYFDVFVFRPDRTAAAVRSRLNSDLSTRVDEIDRHCRLTEAQKQKLLLAGRGDIKRFFDRCEQAKEKLHLAGEKFQKENLQAAGDKAAERVAEAQLMVQMEVEMMQSAAPLQRTLQKGLFQEDSLLYKSLRNTLTDEQAARFEAAKAGGVAARHLAGVERAVEVLGRDARLTAVQRRELVKLLVAEIKPPPKPAPSRYDEWYILCMMRRLPEGRLKPLFDAERWADVSQRISRYKVIEPELRQLGLLPDEGGDGAKAVLPPPGGLEE